MEPKKHFKMYKSGKLWVSAAIVSLSVMAGVAVNGQQAKADDANPTTTAVEAPTVQPAAGDTNNGGSQAGNTNPTNPDQGNQGSETTTADVTVSRTVNYSYADKSQPASTATQTATVTRTTTGGKTTDNTTGKSWSGATLTVPDGYAAYCNKNKITALPTKITTTNGKVNDAAINVVFVPNDQTPSTNPSDNDLKNTDMYRVLTRTIKYTVPGDNSETSKTQTVIFGRTVSYNTDGTRKYGDWQVMKSDAGDNKASWDQLELPQSKGNVAYYVNNGEQQYITAIPAEDVDPEKTKDETINVNYVTASNTDKAEDHKGDKDYWKEVTRTINYKLAVGTKTPEVQTVQFKRNKITTLDAAGKPTVSWTNWEAAGASAWPKFTIPQVGYYHTVVNGKQQVEFAAKTVTDSTPNETYTVTYVSDGTDPYNQQVDPGLRGNWASIDNIYMTDTGIHVTGWNANSDSYNRNYHYLIILDYGPNPVTGKWTEVGRKLVANGVNRSDVFKVHPVWNAATSGFDDTIDLDTTKIKAGDKLRILSRWTSDPNGNNDCADLVSSYYTMDYGTNVGNWDSATITKDGKQLEVTGWNATNQSVGRPNHFVILYDATTNREIARQKVTDGISRPDVSNAYKNLLNASKSGFDVKFDLTNVDLGHNIQIISRYSDADNGEGSHADYWFPAKRFVSGDTNDYGNLDSVKSYPEAGYMAFIGWNATNYSNLEPYHFMILFDTTDNKQVDSVLLTDKSGIADRSDVQRVYPNVANSAKSGFKYGVSLTKLTYGHTYALVSRYSSNADGNGNDGSHVDYWFNNALNYNQQAYHIDEMSFVDDQKVVQPAESNETDDNNQDDDTKSGSGATADGVQTSTAKLHIVGWMASDAAFNYEHAFVIVMDAKDGVELGRQEVQLNSSKDVSNAYPSIGNADHCRFNTNYFKYH